MGQVIAFQECGRRRSVGAAKDGDVSPAWQAPQAFWAEPILSLTVLRVAAVMWAGLALAAPSEVGLPQARQRAPAAARAAALAPFGGRP